MPELPEVETVKEVLKKQIINKTIKKIKIFYPSIIEGDQKEFIQALLNKRIVDIKRYGKYLIFKVEDIYFLSHLRMEGKYFIKKENEEYQKHEHIAFLLDDGMELRYHDTRKFGRMMLKKEEDLYTTKPLVEMGLEPFDEKFTALYLENAFKKIRKPIKEILLDQHIIAGIGNIYADEICFRSRLNPLNITSSLKKTDLENIVNNSREILKEAIEQGGTTIRSYTSSLGVTGRFQQSLFVHGRENQECLVCKTKITKIRVGGRGTYFCACCQKQNL